MSIDYDRFLEWAESRFDDVVVSGAEIKLNSVFCDDRKHHLWCSPSGGKKGHENGVYHCWKSEKKGSLVGLVMIVDKCPYEQAAQTLNVAPGGGLEDLEKRVNEMFAQKHSEAKDAHRIEEGGLEMPADCYMFDELPSGHKLRGQAEEYLKSRRIPLDGLMICTSGRYKNRIMIPYLDRKGVLTYYNGRYIGEPGGNLRYLGPPKELGIGKGDVLYSRSWPSKGDKTYIVEGEIDSMSLDICGFKSVALGGKNMTDPQIDMIKGLRPVLCMDADESGGEALPRIAQRLFRAGFDKIRYIRPCKEHKDWNGMLVARGPEAIQRYIETQEKDYGGLAGGDWEATSLNLNNILG
jgi:DNA primase